MYIREADNNAKYVNAILKIKTKLLSLLSAVKTYGNSDELYQELQSAFNEIGNSSLNEFVTIDAYALEDEDIYMFNYLAFDYLVGTYLEKNMIITKKNTRIFIKTRYLNTIDSTYKYYIKGNKICKKPGGSATNSLDKIRMMSKLRVIN